VAAHSPKLTALALSSVAAIAAAILWAGSAAPRTGAVHSLQGPKRIISLVPSVTEMLFAIGAGPTVVGVGSFDREPPEIGPLPRVGGLLDPNLERILTLRPDLVVAYESQVDLRSQLEAARIPLFLYAHAGLGDVTQTVRELGRRLGRVRRADELAATIDHDLAAVRARIRGRTRPRTLLVFAREPRTLRNIYASGGVGFLHDMLEVAGGANVFGDVRRESLQVTTETLLRIAPEVVVDLRYSGEIRPDEVPLERLAWSALPAMPAVRTGRIYVLAGDEFVIPGPRVAAATEKLARALHPEAF
jgi:iron complex transport system substrate-binding protein